MHAELAIPADYVEQFALPFFEEVSLSKLIVAQLDHTGRPLVVTASTAQAWGQMRDAAHRDGVELLCFSGFRGYVYQKGLIEAKLKRGIALEEILKVLAAPGYSEHHTGQAIDITAPGYPPAEEVFATTSAYEWLRTKAADFGFVETYGPSRPYPIVYEPWHWCFRGA